MSSSSDIYFLQSDRVGFTKWNDQSWNTALELWGDENVTATIGGPFTEEYIRTRLAKEIENQQLHGIQYWPIYHLTTGELVGCCGFRPYHPPASSPTVLSEEDKIIEMGFHLKPKFWGQGIGYEAAMAARYQVCIYYSKYC